MLITVGTSICGGSAIAAVAPVLEASEEEISVAIMGTIFLLNSIALFTFPAIGSALHMTQNQFGLWAALAIHDTSSVVGASARYGPQALVVGTTVKLARPLDHPGVADCGRLVPRASSQRRRHCDGLEDQTPMVYPVFLPGERSADLMARPSLYFSIRWRTWAGRG